MMPFGVEYWGKLLVESVRDWLVSMFGKKPKESASVDIQAFQSQLKADLAQSKERIQDLELAVQRGTLLLMEALSRITTSAPGNHIECQGTVINVFLILPTAYKKREIDSLLKDVAPSVFNLPDSDVIKKLSPQPMTASYFNTHGDPIANDVIASAKIIAARKAVEEERKLRELREEAESEEEDNTDG